MATCFCASHLCLQTCFLTCKTGELSYVYPLATHFTQPVLSAYPSPGCDGRHTALCSQPPWGLWSSATGWGCRLADSSQLTEALSCSQFLICCPNANHFRTTFGILTVCSYHFIMPSFLSFASHPTVIYLVCLKFYLFKQSPQPNVGLELTTLWSKVVYSLDWASQVPLLDVFI